MKLKKIILVGGPTASGKSALALDLARRNDGVIINADALQIYEGLPILTAQPSSEDRTAAPHELYGVMDAAEASSAGKWLALAHAAIERCFSMGRAPILVGGTGMYFRSLLNGLAEIPDIPDDVRAAAEKLYAEIGEAAFRERLREMDPVSAEKLARNDRQRLVRAYEVAQYTKRALGEWQKGGSGFREQGSGEVSYEPHLLLPPREELYAACDKRFLRMMERGAAEEVRAFLKRGLAPALPAMKTIGVREIGAYLEGVCTLEEAIAKAQQMTRNYAKRQMTWFRNQGFGLTSGA